MQTEFDKQQEFNQRPVAATSLAEARENKKSCAKDWPLANTGNNKNAFQLYFYLLSRSAIDQNETLNSSTGEVIHNAYISDGYWTKPEAKQILGVKSIRTVDNNLDKLINSGLLTRDDSRHAYVINTTALPYHTSFSGDILRLFISLGTVLDWVMVIKLYSIILYAYKHNLNGFTITDINYALGVGHDDKINGAVLDMILSWWKELGLVNFEKNLRTRAGEEVKTHYYYYQINKIQTYATPDIIALLQQGSTELTEKWKELFMQTQD